ncbi:MAG: pyridoxamine 5'-phosphate oxidase family protein, partial [Spirochaetaceae bacterium]|nr:pyridoxamine 5'-phosphate oxidase family protein [Spirochaetaceae bacterium]
MPRLSDVVKSAWEDREGAVILTTVDTGGLPNAIYATCVTLFDGDRIVIANNFFDKTMENLQAGSKVSVL